MSKFPVVWDASYETIPLNTEQELLGASRIRDLKLEVRSRMQQDHSWEGDDSDGYHETCTLITQASDPTPSPAGTETAGVIYTKVVNGINELFYKDSSNHILQMTSAGAFNGQWQSGDLKWSANPAAPAGWLFCQGQLLDGTQPQYQALWAAIGNTFGGSGQTQLVLPDTRARTFFGWDPGNGTGRLTNPTDQAVGIDASVAGHTGGEQYHVQNVNELATHTHAYVDPGHAHVYNEAGITSGNGSGGNPQPTNLGGQATSSDVTGIAIENQGGGSAMNVTNPGIVMYCYIKL